MVDHDGGTTNRQLDSGMRRWKWAVKRETVNWVKVNPGLGGFVLLRP